MKRTAKIGLLCILVITGASGSISLAQTGARSASLFVAPPVGIFTVDSTFTVSIYVNTGGNFINAVEANLTFPPDKLQVVSPTAGKSFLQVWVNQPTYSNTAGTLKFQGAVPNPGISTESGLISTVTFRVKSVGNAVLKISDTSQVLLNDGKGTNILGQTTNGVYALTLPPPAGPAVTSPTNPDQEKWYSIESVSFRWEALPGHQGFSYILNQDPSDTPDDISEGTRSGVQYKNLEDGVYYFHIKALRGGVWGGVTHYRVAVDSAPPAAFAIAISPSAYTSNRRPLLALETTDVTSGIDHYEIKIIPVTPQNTSQAESADRDAGTPFFIETVSPYSRQLEIGRYDVVARAYDQAGNYYQATARMTIANPIFEILRDRGIRLGGAFIVPWPYAWTILVILVIVLSGFARTVWQWHREIEEQLRSGVHTHPSVVQKLDELRRKWGMGGNKKHFVFWALLFLVGFSLFTSASRAQTSGAAATNVSVQPPVITLFPNSISNDDILYIGGNASTPDAQVIIYLQNTDNGDTVSQNVATDKDGAWFFSFPGFLNSGRYIIWTQLKVNDEISPPSPRLDLVVAPTAVQIGTQRLSFQTLYLILLVLFGALAAALGGFIVYHGYHFQAKKRRLLAGIQKAEESIRRGFALIRRDIEMELATIHKAKLAKELSFEERLREEKLLKDLDMVSSYIGKEVWEIEKEESEL